MRNAKNILIVVLSILVCCADLLIAPLATARGTDDGVVTLTVELPIGAHRAIQAKQPGSAVEISRPDLEDLYWSVAKALQTTTPPIEQRERDALIAEAVAAEVAAEHRFAPLECAKRIRDMREHPRLGR